jgi:hypothetical protein
MNDGEDLTPIASRTRETEDKTPKGWTLLWDFLRDKPVIGLFLTMAYFLIRPLRFTDEALSEDWKNKMSPPRFLLESYVLFLAMNLVTPFGTLWGDSKLTAIQKAFEEGMQLTLIMLAGFAACFVAHLILNQGRMSFIHGFFLYCYIQGFAWIVGGICLIALYVATGKSMKAEWAPPFIAFTGGIQNRAVVLSLVVFLLAIAMVGCVLASVIRAYRPRWYRFLGAYLAFNFSLAALCYMFGYCAGRISAWLLPTG